MSFEKKIGNSNEKITQASKEVFAKGVKYMFNDKQWIITEVIKDSSSSWRRTTCMQDGTQELITLDTLLKDAQSKNFKFIEGE